LLGIGQNSPLYLSPGLFGWLSFLRTLFIQIVSGVPIQGFMSKYYLSTSAHTTEASCMTMFFLTVQLKCM
jgi:hypothetical protein